MNTGSTFFAPQLYIKNGTHDISFYTKAFSAVEVRKFTNDDGSIHVAELSINGTLFHLHENTHHEKVADPEQCNGTTVKIGLFVPDVDAVMASAKAAGGTEIAPAKSYDYGYRQGEILDPFGHVWLIEMKI